MATALAIIRSELRRSIRGPAWHGPALLEVLSDVTIAEARARPMPRGHSIAEIASHALGWIEEVARRLATSDAALPARGDWTRIPALDATGWADILAQIDRAGDELDSALGAFSEARLLERVGGDAVDPPAGSGVPFGVMLHGLAQHNAYHGGQIAILKRLLRAGK